MIHKGDLVTAEKLLSSVKLGSIGLNNLGVVRYLRTGQ